MDERMRLGIVFTVLCICIGVAILSAPEKIEYVYRVASEPIDVYGELTEWQMIVMAFIEGESDYHTNIIGDGGNALGILQIWKIYVDHVNLLLGYNKYCYEDRTNPERCLEMFEDIQSRMNPGRTLEGACKAHNPKAGIKYRLYIEQKIDNIKRRELIRKMIIE